MRTLKEENQAEKRLVVGELEVIRNIKGGGIDQIKRNVADLNTSVTTVIAKTNNYWSDLAKDNVITPGEKAQLKKEWNVIDQTYIAIQQNARDLDIDTEPEIVAYTAAFTALSNYLFNTLKVFNDMTSNTEIPDLEEFNNLYEAYYDNEFTAQKLIIKTEAATDVIPIIEEQIEPIVQRTVSTTYPRYIGAYTEAPSASMYRLGDWYFNTTPGEDNQVHLYKNVFNEDLGRQEWEIVVYSKEVEYMYAAAAKDLLEYAGDTGDVGYYAALYVKNMFAQKITITSGGSIESENFTTSQGQEGFKLDSNGDLIANNGKFRGILGEYVELGELQPRIPSGHEITISFKKDLKDVPDYVENYVLDIFFIPLTIGNYNSRILYLGTLHISEYKKVFTGSPNYWIAVTNASGNIIDRVQFENIEDELEHWTEGGISKYIYYYYFKLHFSDDMITGKVVAIKKRNPTN